MFADHSLASSLPRSSMTRTSQAVYLDTTGLGLSSPRKARLDPLEHRRRRREHRAIARVHEGVRQGGRRIAFSSSDRAVYVEAPPCAALERLEVVEEALVLDGRAEEPLRDSRAFCGARPGAPLPLRPRPSRLAPSARARPRSRIRETLRRSACRRTRPRTGEGAPAVFAAPLRMRRLRFAHGTSYL